MLNFEKEFKAAMDKMNMEVSEEFSKLQERKAEFEQSRKERMEKLTKFIEEQSRTEEVVIEEVEIEDTNEKKFKKMQDDLNKLLDWA